MTREEAARIIDGAEVLILNRDVKAFDKAARMAIKALRELDAQEKQKPFGEWISVKDRLPEPNVIVLCCTDKGSIDTALLGRYSKRFLTCDGMEEKVGKVIAWMPLPEPPKEEHHE